MAQEFLVKHSRWADGLKSEQEAERAAGRVNRKKLDAVDFSRYLLFRH
jgi:hypothetical protein